MRKLIMILFATWVLIQGANAQLGVFNHMTVGANVGTTGIGADVAMPITRFFDIEAGFSIMPHFKYNTDVHTNVSLDDINALLPPQQQININDIPIQGKLKMVNGKIMINFMPFAVNSFHITVGAYFGGRDVIEVYNREDGQLRTISEVNQILTDFDVPEIGLKVGDYLLTPDANGNVKATLKTKSFKPYVGIGFGRGVVKTKPIGFKVDLGVMFWGSPEVIDQNGIILTKQDWEGKDGGTFKTISRIKVYPVLNFRLCGKIF